MSIDVTQAAAAPVIKIHKNSDIYKRTIFANRIFLNYLKNLALVRVTYNF